MKKYLAYACIGVGAIILVVTLLRGVTVNMTEVYPIVKTISATK